MKVRLTSLLLLLLSGCSVLPVPPKDFSSDEEFNAHAKRKPPFGKIDTFDEVRTAVWAYHSLYAKEAQSKREIAQGASEVGFYSSIVAVIGGVAASPQTAIAGGAAAAGAGLFNDRYRLAVQAHNYELASSALLCMYDLMPGITSNQLARLNFANGVNAENDARDAALDGLLSIRDKLAALQTTFELGKPDLSKLKEALAAPEQKLDGNGQKMRRGILMQGGGEKPVDPIETYRNGVKACVATVTG